MKRFIFVGLLLVAPALAQAQVEQKTDAGTQALNSMIMDQTSREVQLRKMLIEANQKIAEQQKQIEELKAPPPKESPDAKK